MSQETPGLRVLHITSLDWGLKHGVRKTSCSGSKRSSRFGGNPPTPPPEQELITRCSQEGPPAPDGRQAGRPSHPVSFVVLLV